MRDDHKNAKHAQVKQFAIGIGQRQQIYGTITENCLQGVSTCLEIVSVSQGVEVKIP